MKMTFKNLRQLLFESILDEDKSRLIDRLVLPDIDDENKKQKAREEIKSFFKKYNTWENKLDWNKLNSITYADFEKIKDQAIKTKGAQKREIASDIKNIFKSIEYRQFEIVGENKDWLFIAPLTWQAAVYCDSSENQGAGAKWCIGYEESDDYWRQYTDDGSLFIMAFNKNYKSLSKRELQTDLKYMIEYDTSFSELNVWNQLDNDHNFFDGEFGISRTKLIKMFNLVKNAFEKIEKKKIELAKIKLEEKIANLVNIKEINEDYFTEFERSILTNIEIPNNITKIGKWAFYNCRNLENIDIPDSVKIIEFGAFKFCKKLKTIIIPDSVITIEEDAFRECVNLKNLQIGNSVRYIKKYAFYLCRNLENISFGDKLLTIGDNAFTWCKNLRKIVIPQTIKSISGNAFLECDKLYLYFKGKKLIDIKNMKNYPWGLSEKRIKNEL